MENWKNKNCGYNSKKFVEKTFVGKWVNEHIFRCPNNVKVPEAYQSTSDYNRLIRTMTLKKWRNLICEMRIIYGKENISWSEREAVDTVCDDVGCVNTTLYGAMRDLMHNVYRMYPSGYIPPQVGEEEVDENLGKIDIEGPWLLEWLDFLWQDSRYSREIWGGDCHRYRHDEVYACLLTRGSRRSIKDKGAFFANGPDYSE